MDLLLLTARLLHVVLGVFWAGALIFTAVFLLPSIRDAGPDGAKVAAGLMRRRFLDVLPPYPKAAIEFRHDSWMDVAVTDAMRERDVARCVTAIPTPDTIANTSWAYLRLHGGPDYSQYAPDENRALADVVAGGTADPVYAFFDNDTGGAAVNDATALKENLQALGAAVR